MGLFERRVPELVEAEGVITLLRKPLPGWIRDAVDLDAIRFSADAISVWAGDGWTVCRRGDWIVREGGEVRGVAGDVFRRTYRTHCPE